MLIVRYLFAILLAFASPAQAEVTVFAAASLRGVLEEVSEAWGQSVRVSYAGSASLARQISQGAPADVFLSANPDWVAWLRDQNLVAENATGQFIGNSLVLIGQKGSAPVDINQLPEILGADRLAIGHARAVPVGIYAREALTSLGLWQDVAPQLLQTDNVRAALRFVALAEVPYAITYATDAQSDSKVSEVYAFPSHSHSPIQYSYASVSDTQSAQEYLAFLTGSDAQAIFAKFGFLPLSEVQE
jgi:molybdate transport system substrate-binding protein